MKFKTPAVHGNHIAVGEGSIIVELSAQAMIDCYLFSTKLHQYQCRAVVCPALKYIGPWEIKP